MNSDLIMQRLRAANPYPRPARIAGSAWAGEVLEMILAEEPAMSAPRPHRRSRRGLALAVAGAVVVSAGAVAAVTIGREATPQAQQQIRAALAVPSLERQGLTPVPGGIRELLRADTPYGPWVIVSVATRERGTLIADGVIQPDGTLKGSGIAGCAAAALGAPGPAVAMCASSDRPLGAESPPAMSLTGRVGERTATVELVAADGRVVEGHTGGGLFLVVLDEVPAGTSQLVARDESGQVIGTQALTASPGTSLLVPAVG